MGEEGPSFPPDPYLLFGMTRTIAFIILALFQIGLPLEGCRGPGPSSHFYWGPADHRRWRLVQGHGVSRQSWNLTEFAAFLICPR